MKRITVYILFILVITTTTAQNLQLNHQLVINTYNQKGYSKKALDYFNENQISNAEDINLQISMGTTHYLLGNYNKAIDIFLKVNNKDKKEVNYNLAQCYSQIGHNELAIEHLRIYLTSKNKKMRRYIKSDTAFYSMSNSNIWNKLWSEEWYTKYDLIFEDAKYEYDLENYEEAITILNKLNKIRSSMVDAYYLKSLTYLKVDEPKNALITINTAIKKRNKRVEFYATKAIIEIRLNKQRKALASINTAIKIDSTQINYYFTKAEILLENGEINSAVNQLESLMLLVPDYDIYKLAGKIYSTALEYQNALKAYNKCIDLKQNSYDIYILRGNIYQKIFAYEFAEKDYTMALDFEPFSGELYYKRGLTRKEQHKNTSACSDFHKAFKYKYMKANDEISSYCQ